MKKNYKKVLHLTHTDIRSDSRILKEMTVLNKNGYDVFGIGAKLDEGSKLGNQNNNKIVSLNLVCRSFKKLPKAVRHILVILEFAFASFPYCLKFKPKIIHCHDSIGLLIGISLKKLCNAKLIYDAHELESNRNGLPHFFGKLIYTFEKYAWASVDGFITVSPSIRKWYEEQFGQKTSIVAYNSPEISNCKKYKKTYLRKKYKIPKSKKIFLYNGIIGPGRGIQSVLQAFQNKNINSHVVFLGYGEWVSQVQKAEMDHPKIHYHHAVPHNEVVAVSRNADFGLCLIENVSLSDFFSLPNKMFEYVFAGLQILASRFPDIQNLVKKHQLGVVCANDTKSIFKAIKKMEKTKWPKKIRNLNELSWRHQEIQILNLYKVINK